MTTILHSLVIPTRNRPDTAEQMVRKYLTFAPADCFVGVQDASDTSELRDRLRDLLDDHRLGYSYAGPMSMTANWNRAMQFATGRYVTFLGDDDGISLDFYDAVRWADACAIEVLINRHPTPQFWWPDYALPGLACCCTCYNHDGHLEWLRPDRLLDRVPRDFSAGIWMPRIYGGIIRRDAFERIRSSSGDYFRGVTPDHYSTYRICMVVDRVVIIDHPLIIAGACGQSNTSSNSSAADPGWTRHMREYSDLDWPDILPDPATRTVAIMQAEGMVRALQEGGRADLLYALNLAQIYLPSLRADPALRLRNLRRYERACRTLGRGWRRELSDAVHIGAKIVRRAMLRRRLRIYSLDHIHPNGRARFWQGLSSMPQVMDRTAMHTRALGYDLPWRATLTQVTVPPV